MKRETNIYCFFGKKEPKEVRKKIAEATNDPDVAKIRTEEEYFFDGVPVGTEVAEKLIELAAEAWAKYGSVRFREFYAHYEARLERIAPLEDGEAWYADADFIYKFYTPKYKNDKKFKGQTYWRIRIEKYMKEPNAKGTWVKRLNTIRKQLEKALGCQTFVTKNECKLIQTTICEEVE